jgi:hypothetical protein
VSDRYEVPAPSRRERIATAALQGILAAAGEYWKPEWTTAYAHAAVEQADALIAELDKPTEGE